MAREWEGRKRFKLDYCPLERGCFKAEDYAWLRNRETRRSRRNVVSDHSREYQIIDCGCKGSMHMTAGDDASVCFRLDKEYLKSTGRKGCILDVFTKRERPGGDESKEMIYAFRPVAVYDEKSRDWSVYAENLNKE
ncbi:MAG: hypothetical protein V1887_02680 [Candidatus Aenigmatarchaeota archaeon]